MKVKNTVIKNIYYMLTYAFKTLTQNNYDEVASESFENIYDLFAAILVKGVNKQVKQGLYKEYIEQYDNIPTIRGKVNLRDSLKNKMMKKQLLACEYDELSEDNVLNRILKVTLLLLLRENSVSIEHKVKLKKLLLHFSAISSIDPKLVKWERLQFQRSNQSYQMLMNICYFVIEGLLLTTQKGPFRSPVFSDENLNLLFERFVLNYYKEHFRELKVHAPILGWNLVEDSSEGDDLFLPQMRTDIVLTNGFHTLIIDTKFYSQPLTNNQKLSSGNLYQIYSYVKNMDVDDTGNVSGMLLYAQTDANIEPDFGYNIAGNRISAKTLNLDQDFIKIQEQLDAIVAEKFID